MKVVVDRFEGEFAVVELMESGNPVSMPKILLPDAKEGDVVSITVDNDETASRKQRISEKVKGLFDN